MPNIILTHKREGILPKDIVDLSLAQETSLNLGRGAQVSYILKRGVQSYFIQKSKRSSDTNHNFIHSILVLAMC